jgi:hypothetical protein
MRMVFRCEWIPWIVIDQLEKKFVGGTSHVVAQSGERI